MLDGPSMRNPVHSESIWVYRTNRTRGPGHSGGGRGVGVGGIALRGGFLSAGICYAKLLMHDVHTLAHEESNVLGNTVLILHILLLKNLTLEMQSLGAETRASLSHLRPT